MDYNNYSNGVIYKLYKNDDFYVGSSNDIYRRLKQHFTGNSSFSKRYGTPFEYKIIELFPCNNRDELREREQYWIGELKPTLNMREAYIEEEARKIKKAVKRTERVECEICGIEISRGCLLRHKKRKH